MEIRTLIAAVFAVPAFYLTFRYNMHMFQLNGYKNGEHINWLKKNIRQQWILVFCVLLGICRIFLPVLALDIVGYLTLLLIFVVYRAMKHMKSKKKLVYTARVKRMMATDFILTVVCAALVFRFAGWKPLNGVLLILVAVQFFMNLVCNVINHPIESGVNQYYINDAKKKLHQVPDLKIIGVTGSYGKTSVKFYLQTLLQERFHVLVTPESYNTPMGVVRTIRGSLKRTHEVFVCEMGARHVGDIKEICDIVHPHHGVITSIGPQHLETFFNMENIKNTKFELADALPEGGMLFLNGDNAYIQEKAGEYRNKTFYYAEGSSGIGGAAKEDIGAGSVETDGVGTSSVEAKDVVASGAQTQDMQKPGIKSGDGYYASDIAVSQTGTEFTVTAPNGESERFHMRLIGAHNVINVVGAISVANRLGIALKDLRIPVRRIEPVPHRMQMREHGLVTIIDDAYNSNPVGSKAAVETLAMFDGVRILVTPGMVELGDKEREYNYKFGTYAADCCDYILLVGRKHTEPIREGVLSKGFAEDRCLVYDKLEEALSYAYSIKEQGHKYILLENDLPDNY
ncbi:MAG: UDP-N-acetylmuramoyl-tripeptide--D-alanyl-D-alanine ligase [Lachnospiraceae bacterium]|nr:UDP-N-acetylmuramoyl-tripeptide--D-alanyl-D-alanine ligase [Lachnospiraceae bacterium]